MNLVEQIVALHRALAAADVPHAFGGALALAWCTERARGTIDIDLNVFVAQDRAEEVFAALPSTVKVTSSNRVAITTDGQARLWWDQTPVDLFFNTTDFHKAVALRARFESFGGANVPFLACKDLAVFKAFYGRTKDWADLEGMWSAGSLDIESVLGVLVRYLGGTDERIGRLRALGELE